ncbi:MAG: L-type lectin-domain containing protein [Myxococcota bacterium]
MKASRFVAPPFLVLFALPAGAQTSIEEFQLGGSASRLNEECIRLTPDEPYVSGSAWYRAPIDLRRPFEMKMKLVLGEKDLEGADGIVFVFHPTMQTGFRGEGMGFAGLTPSLGLEVDTYQNFHLNDPAADHLALMVNGQSLHLDGQLKPIVSGNLEDGRRHPLRITWSPAEGLRVFLDQRLRATFPPDVVKSTFDSASIVYWGMTAGTGRLSNYQDVCIERVYLGV